MNTSDENMLDVTLLEPQLKHATIFNWFDKLTEGQSFIIHNDHDPKPLYYQLLGERGNVFTWHYLQQGDVWWKVKIGKKLADERDETLGQLAAKDLHKAKVFKKFGLDFCCGGKKTVKQACAEKGIDVTLVEHELQHTTKNVTHKELPFNDWKLDFLADYIVNTHHSYITKNMPDMLAYADKVAHVHGQRHPELIELNDCVRNLANDLALHLIEEEEIIFPLIKALANPTIENKINGGLNTIKQAELEHENVGALMLKIRNLTDNFTLPTDACATYSLLFRMLEEFEEDLHIHIHLENNILFQKALNLSAHN